MSVVNKLQKKFKSVTRTISFFYNEFREIRKGGAPANNEEKQFADFLNVLKQKYTLDSSASEIVLVPLMNDVGMMKMNMALAYKIASEEGLLIRFFYVHTAVDLSLQKQLSLSLIQYWKEKRLFGPRRLRPIFNIRKKEIIISNYFLPSLVRCFPEQLQTKEEILKIRNENILLGDLVYDSYLRFRRKPTINLTDQCLYDILDYAGTMINKWRHLLSSMPIKKVILPYTAYLHWGIAARTAVDKNIEVITYGSFMYIINALRKEHPFHSKDHNLYRSIFEKLDAKIEKREKAKMSLEKRLGGNIDAGTIYMKNSAFHDITTTDFVIKSDKPSAVTFLHCFFDSPHIYGHGLFPDFYEWILFMLNEASANPSVNYYFKPHPNGLPGNVEIIDALKIKYQSFDNIIFIPAKISNKQILSQKPAAVFTFYGTVAHEFAYYGFPVVTAGDNPHSQYDFLYNPASVEELRTYICNVGKFKLPDKYDQNEILEFYYMHYMYYSTKFNQTNFQLQKNFNTGDNFLPDAISARELIYYIDRN